MFTVFVYAAYCRTGQTDKHSEDLPRQGWGEYCTVYIVDTLSIPKYIVDTFA